MSQVTEQSVRFQTALASIKLIQASAVLDLTEDDFDFLTSNKVWIATRSEERFSRNAETDIVCRLLLEKKKAAGADRRLNEAWTQVRRELCDGTDPELRAPRLVERMALVLQGSLLVRYAPAAVADAFCASRLAGDRGLAFGTLPTGLDLAAILGRIPPDDPATRPGPAGR